MLDAIQSQFVSILSSLPFVARDRFFFPFQAMGPCSFYLLRGGSQKSHFHPFPFSAPIRSPFLSRSMGGETGLLTIVNPNCRSCHFVPFVEPAAAAKERKLEICVFPPPPFPLLFFNPFTSSCVSNFVWPNQTCLS